MRQRDEEVHTLIYKKTLENLKAKGLDIAYETIEEVSKVQWEFLGYVIRWGKHESLRMKYFGNWGVKRFREAFMMKRYVNEEQRAWLNTLSKYDQVIELDKFFKEYKERTKWEFDKSLKPVIQYDSKGRELRRFNTLQEASEVLKIMPIEIYIACSKGIKIKSGFTFKFNDDQKEKGESGSED